MEEKGGVDALAAALAVISGNTEIKARSLLSSREVIRGLVDSIATERYIRISRTRDREICVSK